MALHHTAPAEIIDLAHAPAAAPEDQSIALLRTDDVEVIRRVLHRGHSVPQHQVDGTLVLQCLQGAVQVDLDSDRLQLAPGQMTYLAPRASYALTGHDDSVLLMTIVRHAH